MTTRPTTILLTALALLALTAPPAAAWSGPPWLVEDFSTAAGERRMADEWGWYVTERGHRGDSLATRIREGSHYGATGFFELADAGVSDAEEVYWRYWLWLDPGWYVEPPARGKLPGPAGLYGNGCHGGRLSTPQDPCWSARTMFSRRYSSVGDADHPDDGPDDRTLLGSYVYDLDAPEGRGSVEDWDEDVALLEHGRWYCVEGRVRMNTPGRADGVLQNWVDGRLAFDTRDRRFRRAGEDAIRVESMWMNVYYGGKHTSPRDNFVKLDSVAVGPHRLGCADGGTRAGPFEDVGSSVHGVGIDWLAEVRLTKGCDPPAGTLYCPVDGVTREQIASFLVRALSLPPEGRDLFVDDDGSVHEADIQSLANAGITRGCNPPAGDRFCPRRELTRGEMAALLVRAFGLPSSDEDAFVDDGDSEFERDIQALAAAGVTLGCNPPENTRYCPDRIVTRGQLATFLWRAARV